LNWRCLTDCRTHPAERPLLLVRALITAFVLLLAAAVAVSSVEALLGAVVIAFYAFVIALFFVVRQGILVGTIRGNGIRVTQAQLPKIHEIVQHHCSELGISEPPAVYVVESGGLLNAFATRLAGKDYVVLYSEVVELAYEHGVESLSFIIGHELAHVKRKHVYKDFLLFPSLVMPLLEEAYSRACEYTCDGIGNALAPQGAESGILILAAGRVLSSRVNTAEFLTQIREAGGFWVWLAELVSLHPIIPKRLAYVRKSYTKPVPGEVPPDTASQ
jgi:Zn-dependent protease with chaperone function